MIVDSYSNRETNSNLVRIAAVVYTFGMHQNVGMSRLHALYSNRKNLIGHNMDSYSLLPSI